MKHILTLLVVCWFLPALIFAQSSPMILQMDVEEVSGTDEIIAHLRVVQCDSILGFQMGLIWDTNKATFLQIEDEGPKMGADKQTFSTLYANQGFVQSLWVSFPLECVSLDSGVILYALRYKQIEEDVEFTLLADTSVYIVNNTIKPHFETVNCDLELKDVIYINNLNDTLYVQNGGIVSQENTQEFGTLNIFPNPVQGVININGLEKLSGNWTLIDLYGRSIKTGQFFQNPMQIQVNDVPDGFYFIKVQSVNGQFTTKPVLIKNN